MPSFNKVILMGNLTRDPEVRVTPQGTPVSRITLAVNRRMKLSDGSTKDETLFIDASAFGRQAESIGRNIMKGDTVLVEGRLRLDTWETQAGEKRSKIEVIIDTFQIIWSSRNRSGDSSRASGATKPAAEQSSESVEFPSDAGSIKEVESNGSTDDEDVPF